MDICDHCGRLFLTNLHGLVLAELEDRWGFWHEWLCHLCVDELLDLLGAGLGSVTWVRLTDFEVYPKAG